MVRMCYNLNVLNISIWSRAGRFICRTLLGTFFFFYEFYFIQKLFFALITNDRFCYKATIFTFEMEHCNHTFFFVFLNTPYFGINAIKNAVFKDVCKLRYCSNPCIYFSVAPPFFREYIFVCGILVRQYLNAFPTCIKNYPKCSKFFNILL